MTDTIRTITELQALLADNNTAQISAQDLRDAVKSLIDIYITPVTGPAYEITVDDRLLHVAYTNTGVCAITWPTAQITDGREIDIKDADGNASVNNITITPASGLIEGIASYTIGLDSMSVTVYCLGGNLFVK